MSEIATVVDEKRRSFWKPVVALVGVMWVVEILDLVLPGVWNEHGIVSRDLSGLLGIPLAPFLHDGLGHLVANTVPFLVLSGAIAYRFPDEGEAQYVTLRIGNGQVALGNGTAPAMYGETPLPATGLTPTMSPGTSHYSHPGDSGRPGNAWRESGSGVESNH